MAGDTLHYIMRRNWTPACAGMAGFEAGIMRSNTNRQQIGQSVVYNSMAANSHQQGQAETGDQIVRSPRAADALGHALRGVFATASLPADLAALVHRLDRVTHH